MIGHELLAEKQPLQKTLRDARRREAHKIAHQSLLWALSNADEIDIPTNTLRNINYPHTSVDDSGLTVFSIFELDAIGADYRTILLHPGNLENDSDGWKQTVSFSGISIVISPLSDGINYTLEDTAESELEGNPVVIIRETYAKRLEQSPPFVAIHSLHEKFKTCSADSVMSEPFQINEDALGMLTMLESLGFPALSADSIKKALSENATPEEILNIVLASAPEKVQQPLAGGGYQYVWQVGKVWYALYINVQSGQAALELHVDACDNYAERANQSSEVATPFIDTACAAEITHILAENGLKFSDKITKEITRIGGADTFGSVYTQLSREVAKWVNREDRINITNLFLPQNHPEYKPGQDSQYYTEGCVDKEKIAKVLMDLDYPSYGEPTSILFDLIKEALLARHKTRDSQLPVTNLDINISDDACFDVTSFYLQGAAHGSRSVGVLPYEENGVPMLAKSYGGKTHLLLKPTLFNGVNLPKGSLMKKQKDDTWAFLRLTSFTFDTKEGEQVFEAEIKKAVLKYEKAFKILASIYPGAKGYDLASITAGAMKRFKDSNQ